jgi:hypothetical protein
MRLASLASVAADIESLPTAQNDGALCPTRRALASAERTTIVRHVGLWESHLVQASLAASGESAVLSGILSHPHAETSHGTTIACSPTMLLGATEANTLPR